MSVPEYKINYKSDFVLTINGDAGWAVPFCIKFWTGMPSQAYFVGFDGVKYVNCRVGDTPTQLLVIFDDHHLPIGKLEMQIAYHTTIEEFPGSVFDEVTNARDVIVTIDGTDYQVMLDFTGEDAPELEFDLPAYANEAERIQNELQRQQNEAARIAAELQREQATAAAVQGAENVNAQLNGTTLTVTNRNGVSTSVNTKGEQGVPGPVGPEGPQGEQGPKGEKGDTGATGPQGIQGPAGPQGQTGVSITDFVKTGETETDTLYDIEFSDDTTKPVAIPKGEKGDQGEQGPEGPQGPMGDVAVITPEQQAAFTMYSETGQNTNGPMTQKAVTDALGNIAASGVSYNNSESGLTAENVQVAIDKLNDVNLSNGFYWEKPAINATGNVHYGVVVAGGYFTHVTGTGRQNYRHRVFIRPSDAKFFRIKTTSAQYSQFCFAKTYSVPSANNTPVDFCDGYSRILVDPNTSNLYEIPSDCSYIIVNYLNNSVDYTPEYIEYGYEEKGFTPVGTDATGDKYGWYDTLGNFNNQTGSTIFLRKFPVTPTRQYYADIRMVPTNSDSIQPACGIAFFDENDVFICGQYNNDGYNVAKEYDKVHITVPPNASYAYVLGTDGSFLNSSVIPNLFMLKDSDAEHLDFIEHFVMSFALLGNGNTTVTMTKGLELEPNCLYKLKADPADWDIPDPTSTTSAILIQQYEDNNSTYLEQDGILQNSFAGLGDGLYFSGNPKVSRATLFFRAITNQPVRFTLFKYDYDTSVTKGKIPALADGGHWYQLSKIKNTIFLDSDSSSEITCNEVDSAWGVAFPSSYSPTGNPTQVLAMLHGASGWVDVDNMGYPSNFVNWKEWRKAYLNAGFIVMDINGNGISTSSDTTATHWANPRAIETIDKAFEELKGMYNVCDKLLIHGSSMGGATGWAYALSHPNKVAGMGLFAPATVSWIILTDTGHATGQSNALAAWMYANLAEAEAEDFVRIVGYDPYMALQKYEAGLLSPISQRAGCDVVTDFNGENVNTIGVKLPCPVRIWHGSSDATVPIALSENLVKYYRNAGNDITLRICPGRPHGMCTGDTAYVIPESITYFQHLK